MKKQEAIALQANSIVFDNRTNEILVVTNSLSTVQPISDDEIIPCTKLGGLHSNGIKLSEVKFYELLTDESPVDVQLKFTQFRLTALENFVTSRLK